MPRPPGPCQPPTGRVSRQRRIQRRKPAPPRLAIPPDGPEEVSSRRRLLCQRRARVSRRRCRPRALGAYRIEIDLAQGVDRRNLIVGRHACRATPATRRPWAAEAPHVDDELELLPDPAPHHGVIAIEAQRDALAIEDLFLHPVVDEALQFSSEWPDAARRARTAVAGSAPGRARRRSRPAQSPIRG